MAVTFDDGFNLNRRELIQIFQDYGIKITSFVITSCIDNKNLMWRNKLSVVRSSVPESVYVSKYNELMLKMGYRTIESGRELMSASLEWEMSRKDELADELWSKCGLPPIEGYLKEHEPYFTWDGLKEWIEHGHSVGFHTHTHPLCSRLASEDIEEEIVKPASELRRKLGLSSLAFSYPFGDRFQPAKERELFDRGVFDCAFGIEGAARCNSLNYRLERAGVESEGVLWPVFGKSLLESASPWGLLCC
jgi:peptidoglycan/xylan/chitin deacetylase (PgdA/CDA1 family)